MAFYGLVGRCAISGWRAARSETGRSSLGVTFALTTLTILGFSRITGPFVLTPVVVCTILMSLSAIPQLHDRKAIVIAWTITAVMLPFVLEWLGVINRTYHLQDGFITLESDVFGAQTRAGEAALVLVNLVFLVIAGLFAMTVSKHRRTAQRELQIRAWHLRQLLPEAARHSSTTPCP